MKANRSQESTLVSVALSETSDIPIQWTEQQFVMKIIKQVLVCQGYSQATETSDIPNQVNTTRHYSITNIVKNVKQVTFLPSEENTIVTDYSQMLKDVTFLLKQ